MSASTKEDGEEWSLHFIIQHCFLLSPLHLPNPQWRSRGIPLSLWPLLWPAQLESVGVDQGEWGGVAFELCHLALHSLISLAPSLSSVTLQRSFFVLTASPMAGQAREIQCRLVRMSGVAYHSISLLYCIIPFSLPFSPSTTSRDRALWALSHSHGRWTYRVSAMGNQRWEG